MSDDPSSPLTRRGLFRGSALVYASAVLVACGEDTPQEPTGRAEPRGNSGRRPPSRLKATPACDDGDEPTPAQTEGPYYSPDTPSRRSLLEPGMSGKRLHLSGVVVDEECRPIPKALLDFWQADADGAYDNEGYRLRGHQFSDARGRFRLSTVVPGRYPGRTRHIHVKAQRPRGQILTTQLYFPGEADNAGDGLFDRELLMDVSKRSGASRAAFTFVLA